MWVVHTAIRAQAVWLEGEKLSDHAEVSPLSRWLFGHDMTLRWSQPKTRGSVPWHGCRCWPITAHAASSRLGTVWARECPDTEAVRSFRLLVVKATVENVGNNWAPDPGAFGLATALWLVQYVDM